MFLRNIQVGDDLSNATLFCEFPDDLYKQLPDGMYSPIIDANKHIISQKETEAGEMDCQIYISYHGFLYDYSTIRGLDVNLKNKILPSDMGVVTSVYKTHPAYKYIFIEYEPTKTTVAEVNKTTQALSIKGELIETTTTLQLTTDGNIEATEFIEEQAIVYRNIEIGDDLSGKTLYLNFPEDLYTQLPTGVGMDNFFIESTSHAMASDNYMDNSYTVIYGIQKDWMGWVSDWYETEMNTGEIVYNLHNDTLPEDFGVVINIDTSHPAYKYIKIKETTSLVPIDQFQIKPDGTIEASEFIEQ